jgi:anti-sigma factor RsiW
VKARILSLNSEEHRLAQELLPWFVNETLDTSERAVVTEHLARCSVCQADAASQAQLRAVAVDASPSSDVDRAWSALRRRLELAPHAAGRKATLPWWRQRLRLALAVQSTLIVLLVVALVRLAMPVESFRTMGSAEAATQANAIAVFRDDATEAQMSAALRAAGARIVGGPTVTDAYLLRLADASPDGLRRLRAQPGVLRVESLQGEPTR